MVLLVYHPLVIMAPISVTLVGIVTAHAMLGAFNYCYVDAFGRLLGGEYVKLQS